MLPVAVQIEGTPCLKVKTGKLELVTLTKHFGGSAKDLTYMGVEISAEDMQKLGMARGTEDVQRSVDDQMYEAGSCAHHREGGGRRQQALEPGSVMGGIEITSTFAVLARETGAENGGWL